MPYGYEKFRLSNGISPNTVVHEVRMIRSLLGFINQKYKKTVEPHEIRPIDIHEYLDNERSSGIKDTTVNRKLTYIRGWFDYLWEIGKVPLDFMPKLKYAQKLDLKSASKIDINYVNLLSIKPQLLKEPRLALTAKLLFIFYMKGVRVRDIIEITVANFEDHGDVITLRIEKKSKVVLYLTFDEPEEITVLLSGIERAIFRGVSYLFSSKIAGEFVILRVGSIKDYIISLTDYLGFQLRSEEMRFAYVHYLYNVRNMKIEDIQEQLGTSLHTTTRLLKESLERMRGVDYNVERTNKSSVN